MPNRPSRIAIPIFAPSYDGYYYGRWPQGDKPAAGAALAGDAQDRIAGSAAITTAIRLAIAAASQSAGSGGISTGIKLAGAGAATQSASGTLVGSVGQKISALIVTSTAGGSSLPWTAGHAFKQGHVPSGYYVTSDESTFQADVRNRWPDGSVKFAVMSGLSTLTAGAPKAINLSATTAAPSGSNVTEPTTLDVEVVLTSVAAGTYTLQSCLGIDRSTWSKASGGRVRQMLGPVMSEFHYYLPTTDAHLAIWFYVRKYSSGAVEVETVIENGWLNVASPNVKSYGVTHKVNGSTTYTGSLTHYHHTRWSRVDWTTTDPAITYLHDAAYLRRSKMVPNYGYNSPSSSAFTGLASAINPTPFALGQWSSSMADTGYQEAIGLLPRWEALYCSSGDARARDATISNNRGSGRWPIHYRDETTGRVPVLSSYPAMSLTSGWGTSPPAAVGGGPAWDIPHHPSNGYLAYLIEGRWSQLESCQFTGMFAAFDANPDTRYNASGGTGGLALVCINAPMTTRGLAWAVRSVAQAAAISPSTLSGADDAVQNCFAAIVQDTATVNYGRYVTGTLFGGVHDNTVGWIGGYDGGDEGPATEYWEREWMRNFQATAMAHMAEIGIEGLTTPSHVDALRDHCALNAVLKTGNEASWNFRRLALYNAPVLKSSSTPSAPVFMSIAEQFTSYKSFKGLSTLSANSGDTMKGHSGEADIAPGDSSDDVKGYLAGALAVLAYAVDAGIANARTGFNLVRAAPNVNPHADGASDTPQFGLVPRDTPISILAASLSPGQSSTALSDNDLGSTIRSTFQWASVFKYDHDRGRAYLLGKNASSQGSQRSNCVYDANTNHWAGVLFGGSELGHVYNSIAVDPETGDVYTGTWATQEIKRWSFGSPLATWTDPYITSSQTLTSGVQPSLCWHPNLYGVGDGGLVVMSEPTGGGQGRIVVWRKSTNTWAVVSGTTHSNTAGYPQRGGMCYVGAGDYVLAAFNPTTGGHCYKIGAGVNGTLATATTVNDVPIECHADDEGINVGILLEDPSGANSAYILEKLGTGRVWKLVSGAWVLQGFTHTLNSSNGFYLVAALNGLGCFWRVAQDDGTSKVWRPNG